MAAVLALMSLGGGVAGAAALPEGPLLAFTALTALKPWGLTVRTVGTDMSRPLPLIRGSREGVVPKPLSGTSWSVDGNWIAFAASQRRRDGLFLVRPDGTGLRFLRGTRGAANPIFSPNGRKIAFDRQGEGKFFFATTPWVANANGGGARQLADWREDTLYTPSSFTPDGSALAVTKGNVFHLANRNAVLLSLDKDGGAQVLAHQAAEPVFSPDGTRIAFVRYSILRRREVLHKDLHVMNVDGTADMRVTHTPSIAESYPSWDPSGQRIAFNSFRISRDPIDALWDLVLPVGNSIIQINADGTCRTKLLSLRNAALYGGAWRPGPSREAGRIPC